MVETANTVAPDISFIDGHHLHDIVRQARRSTQEF